MLGFKLGIIRDIDNLEAPSNLANCTVSDEHLMAKGLHHMDNLAPWLTRTDSVSKNRLRMMSGMSTTEWENWLANPQPIPLSGRLGELIQSEKLELSNSIPIIIIFFNLLNDFI